MKKSTETVDTKTGLVSEAKLNEVIVIKTIRPNKTRRIQQDFEYCPTLAEQHTAHLTDLNYLMEKFKPDELAAYLAARTQHRTEINNHDFASEPSLQDAKNVIYQSKSAFNALPEEIKNSFSSHLEFLKFIDNPKNAQKMQKLGLLTQQQINEVKIETETTKPTPTTTTT